MVLISQRAPSKRNGLRIDIDDTTEGPKGPDSEGADTSQHALIVV